jgi:multiple sugar transport system permease protein
VDVVAVTRRDRVGCPVTARSAAMTDAGSRAARRAVALFLAPGLLLIVFTFLVPAVASFVLSLTDFDLYAVASPGNARLVWLRNYVALAHSPLFWTALRNTLYFVLVGGPLSVLVSLGVAVLLDAPVVRFRSFFRAVFFAPVVTTLVAVAVVWKYLYAPGNGLLDVGLHWFGIRPIDWLGSTAWAMPALILMTVWKNFGYNMIIFLAGLQAVPLDLYDAARVDGAGPLQRFRHVTLPTLAPTFLFVSITTMIGYLQLFSEPYVMTQGGPLHGTLSLVLYMFDEGFQWWHVGFSAAVAFTLFVLTLIGAAIQLRARPATAEGG